MNLRGIPSDERLPAFAQAVSDLCQAHTASVTSWWRTRARNQAKGGRPDSFHLEGLAADLVPDNPNDRSALIIDAHARGLDAADEGDHIHIELDYRNHPQE